MFNGQLGLLSGSYLIISRERSIIFIVIIWIYGLDFKFNTEVVAVRVWRCVRDLWPPRLNTHRVHITHYTSTQAQWTTDCASCSLCCASQMIGCCVFLARSQVLQSHTRTGCRRTSASSCQTVSFSCLPLPPPPPSLLQHPPRLHCVRDLQTKGGRSLVKQLNTLNEMVVELVLVHLEEKLTWLIAPAAPPSPPPSPPPVRRWRATFCFCRLKAQTRFWADFQTFKLLLGHRIITKFHVTFKLDHTH